MTSTEIFQQEESIYDVFNPRPRSSEKRFRSKYLDIIKSADSLLLTSARKYSTIGPCSKSLPNPKDYLKKGSGRPCYPKCEKHECTRKESTLSIQRELEYPKSQNFRAISALSNDYIKNNQKWMIQSKSMTSSAKPILTRKRDKSAFSSETEPVFRYKDHLGQVPEYVKNYKRKKEFERECQKALTEVQGKKGRYVFKDEREELLTSLKSRWRKLQSEYLNLPVVVDTIFLLNKKTKLEKKLKALETDINALAAHPYFYVYGE